MAEQGSAVAQYNVGGMYKDGRGVEKEDNKAVRWYCEEAEQCHVLEDMTTFKADFRAHSVLVEC